MTIPNELSRRRLLRRAAAASLVTAGGGLLTTACASGGEGNDGNNQGGAKSAENPFGVKADAPLEVVIFKGAHGDDYAIFHESLYKKKFPDAQITHRGITDIRQQMQPRFNAGDPPDVLSNEGGQALPRAALVSTGQLMDLAPLFDADSIDKPGTKVRDTVAPIILDPVTLEDGKRLVLPYVMTVYGIWYDKKLFADRGWRPAKTWPDFLTLCEEIKKSGIAPLAHQGKHPYYILQVVLAMAIQHGGQQVMYAIDSLEPNAWKHPSIKLAAEALAELKSKGYIMQGTEGLDHIQSQTRWNERQAAFIPSGSWLENEQKTVAPNDFVTTVAPTPLLDGAKLPFESAIASVGGSYIIPAKAKNQAGALEYLRIMLSKEGARKFTELAGSPTVVTGAAEGLTLTPGAASSAALIDAGGKNNTAVYYANWYGEMGKAINSVAGELAAGRITADAFMSQCQKVADDIAKDPKTVKRTRG